MKVKSEARACACIDQDCCAAPDAGSPCPARRNAALSWSLQGPSRALPPHCRSRHSNLGLRPCKGPLALSLSLSSFPRSPSPLAVPLGLSPAPFVSLRVSAARSTPTLPASPAGAGSLAGAWSKAGSGDARAGPGGQWRSTAATVFTQLQLLISLSWCGAVAQHSLASLGVLGTVGEPINAEAWR